MHELSVCTAIADAVRQHTGDRPVRSVRLRIGYLRQLLPDSLEFCWSMVTDRGPLAGSELIIDHIPAEVECRGCGRRTVLDHPVLRCPGCSGSRVEVVAGEECLITSIDVGPVPASEGE